MNAMRLENFHIGAKAKVEVLIVFKADRKANIYYTFAYIICAGMCLYSAALPLVRCVYLFAVPER